VWDPGAGSGDVIDLVPDPVEPTLFSYGLDTGDLDGDGLIDIVVAARVVLPDDPTTGHADILLQDMRQPGNVSGAPTLSGAFVTRAAKAGRLECRYAARRHCQPPVTRALLTPIIYAVVNPLPAFLSLLAVLLAVLEIVRRENRSR